ncbi:MAG: restriction endonuclease [Candidatus Kapaibacterium sp.]
MPKNKFSLAIANAGLNIYDPVVPDSIHWIPTPTLEEVLKIALIKLDTSEYPIRTRAKVVKAKVAEAMGYPVPLSFKKTQPRFPGQDLDVYVQQSRNLQIWNEAITLSRRYAIVIVSPEGLITDVRVVTGNEVQAWDKTGKLTSKYQAILKTGTKSGLLSSKDTAKFRSLLSSGTKAKKIVGSPLRNPTSEDLLSIKEVYSRLKSLVGKTLAYSGAAQERNRGALLHESVCLALGYSSLEDNGRFPDVTSQLLEIKLQLSQTIDLGLTKPDSTQNLEEIALNGRKISPADIRYALFGAVWLEHHKTVRLENLYLVTGADFFKFFKQMMGKEVNRKLQIPMPISIFGQASKP